VGKSKSRGGGQGNVCSPLMVCQAKKKKKKGGYWVLCVFGCGAEKEKKRPGRKKRLGPARIHSFPTLVGEGGDRGRRR